MSMNTHWLARRSCDYGEIGKVALECLVARLGGTVRP